MARTTDSIPNSLEVRPLCICAVSGLTVHRVNDVLFRPALSRVLADPNFKPKTLVFFGGDVQNFLSAMDTSDSKINCHRWCLEFAAHRLGSNFPCHHIVVIRPSRTLCEHVNCFDNFVHGNYVGAPTHVYQYRSLVHLERILYKISKRIRRTDSDELFKLLLKKEDDEQECVEADPTGNIVWQYEIMPEKRKEILIRWQKSLHLDRYPLTLAAFSKGCVVLNQFLYEFHYARGLEPKMYNSSFIDRIEHMYWLDGGHPGRTNVYPTSLGVLRTVSELGIHLHLHVSQYQIDDYIRPWIREQCNEFIDRLRYFNAKLVVYGHVSRYTDLRAHFSVFLTFMHKENSPPPSPVAPPPRRSPSPPPPPRGPHLPPHTPQERATIHREILGLALVSPNDSPDLGLQLILRRPLMNNGPQGNAQSNVPSSGSTGSNGQNNTGQSSQRSGVTSRDPARSNSGSQMYEPGEGPSSAPDPDPSASTEDAAKRRRLADGFEVLVKNRSARIDFTKDPEALEAYETARYYWLERPVIATLTSDPKQRALNIYTPVKEHYTPTILNQLRQAQRVDSRNATTPANPGSPGPSAATSGQSPQPGTSRDSDNTTHRNRSSRYAVENVLSSRHLSHVLSFSSSSDSSEDTSDTEPPRGRSVRRNSPYARRGTHRYNLRSSR